ncbi:MAG: hypothetical protein K6A65_05740 [Succinivibrionaceae bacterium]|nr:hypothetical protein [Succinivibrionaceae bacterium]
MDTHTLGLLLGLLGAAAQAANYALAKDCQVRHGLYGLRQLAAVHALMLAVVALPFLILGHWRHLDLGLARAELLVVAPYLAAQWLLFRALALSEASVVSPLLTIKVPILAAIAHFCLGKEFSATELFAIAAIIALGLALSALSGRLSRLGLMPLLLLSLSCACFALSDLATAAFMERLTGVDRPGQVALAITYEYVTCGLIALPFLRALRVGPRDVAGTAGVGAAWLVSMVGLIACFNLSGVVEGNIVQTLRGVLGILIAYAFYRGYIKDRGTFRKKLVIALLMCASVALYYC